MTKIKSLIRETIFRLLEEETKYNQGDTINTLKDGEGIVQVSKHPYYSVQLNSTGITKSYHYSELLPVEPIESEFGKYDIDGLEEITINSPTNEYIIQGYHISYPYHDPIKINGNQQHAIQTTIDKLKKDSVYNHNHNQDDFWAIIYIKNNKDKKEIGRVNLEDGKFQFYTLNKKTINESPPEEIIHINGILYVNEEYNVGDVLSGIRSITGITVVRPIDIPGETHKNKLLIKVDPFPFLKKNEASILSQLKITIRKIPGVKEFWTQNDNIVENKIKLKIIE